LDIVHTRRWKSIGLTQRYMECVNSVLDDTNLWNNLGFSLCTTSSVCYMENQFVDELCQHFGLSDPIDETANMLDNLCMKPSDKISTYNVDFICYASQLGWGNSVLCYCYYQGLPNWIQDPISIWEQEKPILFQNMYALAMIINHCYWKWDHECYHARQAEKKALESHFWK